MKVLQFPLARITIAFVLGILAAFYAKPNLQISINCSVSLLFLFLELAISYQKKVLVPHTILA